MTGIITVTPNKGVVYVRVSKGGLGGMRKEIKTKVEETEGEKKSKRFYKGKELIPREAVKDITAVDSQIDSFINHPPFLPGLAPGERCVPESRIKYVHKRLNELFDKRQDAIDKFMDSYPSIIEIARVELGPEHFDATDFPPPEKKRAQFYAEYSFRKFSEVPDGLPPEILVQEKEKVAKELAEQAKVWRMFVRQRLFQIVKHMADRLTPDEDGKKKRYDQAAMIANFKQLIEEGPFMDVTGDSEFQKQYAALKEMASKVTSDTLEDEEMRVAVGKEFSKMEESLAAASFIEGPDRLIELG